MTEAVPNYSELHKEVKREIAASREKIRGVVGSVFADFFRKFPDVYGAGWVQYTPSWNDGDTTEFQVNELQLYLDEESADDNEEDQYILRHRSGDSSEKIEALGGEERVREIIAHFKPVEDFIQGMDEDNMLLIFGNGAKVIATKDGIEVEDYSDEDNY